MALQPRCYVLGGMQGVVSLEDLGGSARVKGKYADPCLPSRWWVTPLTDYTVRVVHLE